MSLLGSVSLRIFCLIPKIGLILESGSLSRAESFAIESPICVCELIKPGISKRSSQLTTLCLVDLILESIFEICYY